MILLTAAAGSGMYRDTTVITTAHLILIVVLVAIVVAGMLWGMRQKRAREAGEQLEERRNEAMLAHPPTQGDADGADGADAGNAGGAAPVPEATQAQTQRQATGAVVGERVDTPAPASDASMPAPAMPAPASPPVAPAPPPLGDMGLGVPATTATAGSAAAGYRLSDIKGLGPKAEPLLAGQNVTSVAELAALDDTRAAEVDAGLGALRGRLARDRWVEQARLLAAGDRAGFEATFGKL